MTLLHLIALIIIAGVLLWAVNAFIPMAPIIKSLLNLLVFVVLLIYILQFFGILKMIIPYPPVFK